ncbi:MAG: substrate-binding domain-containing protein [Rhodobacteraceae bacterium]|nr:substrate-binding domain-containing protein [Paracoccaceae bacterium]
MPARAIASRPTLRTIADETGFAVATVSRALANDPKIAEKTREAVANAARRLNYVPDRAAQRLRTGRTKVISVLLNLEHEFIGFTDEFLGGILGAVSGTEYAISVIPDIDGPKRMEIVRKIIHHRLSDGVILTQTEPFDDRVRALAEARLPFVTHGRTEFTLPHAWVDFDNEAFARNAVRRLVEQGRTRLLMIQPDARFTFAQHLRYGFQTAARDAGVGFESPETVTLSSPSGQIEAFIRDRQLSADAPDGHICVGEVVALATLAALADTGKQPGRDVSVLAKKASPIFKHVRPQIETVTEDLRATGLQLGHMLLRQINGAAPDNLHLLMTPDTKFSISA